MAAWLSVACLCDLRDARGRVLLMRRRHPPNAGLWSPIGGKVEPGESPAMAARREIREEAGVNVDPHRLRLAIVWSERAVAGPGSGDVGDHWLMFVYRVMEPVEVREGPCSEGDLAWVEPGNVDALAIPVTDREILWPILREAECSRGPIGIEVGWVGGRLMWHRI